MAILAMVNLGLLIANFLFMRCGSKTAALDNQHGKPGTDSLAQPQLSEQ